MNKNQLIALMAAVLFERKNHNPVEEDIQLAVAYALAIAKKADEAIYQ